MNIIYECVDRCEVWNTRNLLKERVGKMSLGWRMSLEGNGWDLRFQIILAIWDPWPSPPTPHPPCTPKKCIHQIVQRRKENT